MSQVIEVEVDGPRSENWFCLPLERVIRGRFDFSRDSNPLALVAAQELGLQQGVPGERLVLDLDAMTATVVEQLYDPAHKATRKAIEKRGEALQPERQSFPVKPGDVATWSYWLKRGVECGIVKVLKGALPAKVEGKPRKSFVTSPRKDPRDGLIERLTAILYANLPESKRAQVEQLLNAEEP
jgi:hypothetical protein